MDVPVMLFPPPASPPRNVAFNLAPPPPELRGPPAIVEVQLLPPTKREMLEIRGGSHSSGIPLRRWFSKGRSGSSGNKQQSDERGVAKLFARGFLGRRS
jgi:hypothetical protein